MNADTSTGFKWFGEGFDGFPKHLPDDCVEYAVYVIDEKLRTEGQVRNRLKAIKAAAHKLVAELLAGYIWQRDGFSLELRQDNDQGDEASSKTSAKADSKGVPFLSGTSSYGDSLADEWVIVYLLRTLSIQFPDAWIRAFDSDGEFLLIEAAKALPRWLNPEIAENRVWINSGRLLIIPLEDQNGSSGKREPRSRSLKLTEALMFLSKQDKKLIDSPLIEEEAFFRIRNYPSDITDNMHNALITIPRRLAFVLHEKPEHISPAIEAFYLRDPISLRPLNGKKAGALQFPPDDLVTVSAKFTKVGYSQLKSQDFPPPAAWANCMSRSLSSKENCRLQAGTKVTCGFEMLLADPQNQDKKSVREIKLLLGDLEQGEDELPSDEAISQWLQLEDDEGWLDINFEAFDRELSGKTKMGGAKHMPGFGDKTAEEKLRKIVERFQSFLDDDTAGVEGAEELDEMDYDDDESGTDAESEDQNASFDEKEFADIMRQMMGMPDDRPSSKSSPVDYISDNRVQEIDTDEDEDTEHEVEEMQKVMRDMEHELKELGALDINVAPMNQGAIKHQRPSSGSQEIKDKDTEMDYNLARNLLESFKAQGGAAGPAGTMMSMMGVQFPRDEGEEHESEERVD